MHADDVHVRIEVKQGEPLFLQYLRQIRWNVNETAGSCVSCQLFQTQSTRKVQRALKL